MKKFCTLLAMVVFVVFFTLSVGTVQVASAGIFGESLSKTQKELLLKELEINGKRNGYGLEASGDANIFAKKVLIKNYGFGKTRITIYGGEIPVVQISKKGKRWDMDGFFIIYYEEILEVHGGSDDYRVGQVTVLNNSLTGQRGLIFRMPYETARDPGGKQRKASIEAIKEAVKQL